MPAFAPRVILAAGLGLLALAAHAGEIYQWKDAKGVTHYSDSPPPGQPQAKSRTVRTTGGVTATTAAAAAAPAENKDCLTARKNLQQIDAGLTLGVDKDGDGKVDGAMSKEQIAQQKQLAQAAIAVNCTQPAAAPGGATAGT